MPVYLYSEPSKTVVGPSFESIVSLSEHENGCGLKDFSGDLVNLHRELYFLEDDFEVFVRHGGAYAEGTNTGATGVVLTVADIIPDRAARLLTYRRA